MAITATAARSRPAPVRARRPEPREQPRLTVLARPRTRRAGIIPTMISSVLIVLTIALMLALNLATSATSFELTRLHVQERSLAGRQQQLQEQVDRLGTPQELDRRARALGMVPAGDPAYIDLATGRIVGEGGAVPAAPAPAVSAPPVPIPHSTVAPYHGMGGEPR